MRISSWSRSRPRPSFPLFQTICVWFGRSFPEPARTCLLRSKVQSGPQSSALNPHTQSQGFVYHCVAVRDTAAHLPSSPSKISVWGRLNFTHCQCLHERRYPKCWRCKQVGIHRCLLSRTGLCLGIGPRYPNYQLLQTNRCMVGAGIQVLQWVAT